MMGPMRVVISDRAYAGILAETAEKVETETGGLFLGQYDAGVFYVVESIDPGPESIFEVAYFEYDKAYTQHLINKVANLYNQKLDLIGLWHRHPGSFDRFSATDDGTNAKYAAMRDAGAISALVNIDPDFRITMYHVSAPHRYKRIPYAVGDNLIPDEILRLKPTEHYLELMDVTTRGRSSRSEKLRLYVKALSLSSYFDFIRPQLEKRRVPSYDIESLARDEESRSRVIECVIDDIGYLSDELKLKISVHQDKIWLKVAQETIDGIFEVLFSYVPDEEIVVLSIGEVDYLYTSGMLKVAGERELRRRQSGLSHIHYSKEWQASSAIGAFLRVVAGQKTNEGE